MRDIILLGIVGVFAGLLLAGGCAASSKSRSGRPDPADPAAVEVARQRGEIKQAMPTQSVAEASASNAKQGAAEASEDAEQGGVLEHPGGGTLTGSSRERDLLFYGYVGLGMVVAFLLGWSLRARLEDRHVRQRAETRR